MMQGRLGELRLLLWPGFAIKRRINAYAANSCRPSPRLNQFCWDRREANSSAEHISLEGTLYGGRFRFFESDSLQTSRLRHAIGFKTDVRDKASSWSPEPQVNYAV